MLIFQAGLKDCHKNFWAALLQSYCYWLVFALWLLLDFLLSLAIIVQRRRQTRQGSYCWTDAR